MTPSTPERPRRRSPPVGRRSIDDTRALLIATGAEMVADESAVTVGRIDLIDVCRQAGLTSVGSAYKIWDTQEDYRVDLLRHVLSRFIPGRDAIDLVTTAVAEDPAALPSLAELIRTAAATIPADGDDGARHFSVYVGLWLASADDEVLARELHDSDVALIDAYAELYDAVIDAYGLEWKPPFDARFFATMVAALTDGLTVRSGAPGEVMERTLTRRVGDGPGEPTEWSLLACAVDALAQAFSRPRRAAAGDAPDLDADGG